MDILDILLDILLKPPQPFIGLFFFKKKFWRTQVLSVEPLIPLFLTSSDVSSVFQSQIRPPYSHLADAYILYILHVP